MSAVQRSVHVTVAAVMVIGVQLKLVVLLQLLLVVLVVLLMMRFDGLAKSGGHIGGQQPFVVKRRAEHQ